MKSDEVGTTLKHLEKINGNVNCFTVDSARLAKLDESNNTQL